MTPTLHPIQLKSWTIPCNVIAAPLAGYTSLATRLAYRHNGSQRDRQILCFAEMVSAEGLYYSFDKSAALLATNEADRPFGIQIFGATQEKIKRAFDKIKDYPFDVIDLNCGCSIKKVLKSFSGAYLLKSPDEIYRILSYLVSATDKPVTLKIRSGYNRENVNYLEVLAAAEAAGAQMITLHPRTCMQLFNGKADWSQIADLKAHAHIPVIGNGDIFSVDDALTMMEQTGCDGVMLARGLIDDPFLMEEVCCRLEGSEYQEPLLSERVNAMLSHLQGFIADFGELPGLREFRKFTKGYLKGIPDIAKLRYNLNFAETYEEFERLVREFIRTVFSEN